MDQIQLFYFPVRGKGEFIRLLLHVAGQHFDNNIIPRDTWGPDSAEKKATPYGQLPYVIYKGKKYGQSMAIASFFAQKFGLKGKEEEDGLRVDEIVQLAEDARPLLRDWYIARAFQKDEQKEAEAAKKAKEEGFPRYFGYFEEKLVDNGATGFFVGDSVSLADLVVYDYIDTALNIDPDCLAVFPSLQKLRENVSAHPNLKDYLGKRPKTDI